MNYQPLPPFDVGWNLLPCFLIRSTGFPFEWLDELRLPDSYHYCQQLAAYQTKVDEMQHTFNQSLFPQILAHEQQREAGPAVFRRWYKLNRLIGKRQPCPATLQQQFSRDLPYMDDWTNRWNESLATIRHMQAQLDKRFETELTQVRLKLQQIVKNNRFQEALFLSNPALLETSVPSYLRRFQPEHRPAKTRYRERQLMAYLQRFCTKNDTASFFGPIDYGRYDSQTSAPFVLTRQPTMPARRLTRLAYWAAQALADHLAADPAVQPYLVPRLQDGCRLLSTGFIHVTVTDNRLSLPRDLLELLRHIDGRQTVAAICHQIGPDSWQRLQSLIDKGLVQLGLKIPTTVFDPLNWLCDWVDELPAHCTTRSSWQQRLAYFQHALDAFPDANLADKQTILHRLETYFNNLTRQPARRGQGQVYADRLILYDEAQGDILACTIGRSLHTHLRQQLCPTLDLCASYSLLLQQLCRQVAGRLLPQDGRSLPYLAFVRQLEETVSLERCQAHPEAQNFLTQLSRLAQAKQTDNDTIRLKKADLAPLLRPIPPGIMASPDIFLSAANPQAISRGDYQLIIGEIHYGVQVWCHFLTFYEQQANLAQALEQHLPPPSEGVQRAALLYGRTQGKTFYLEPPGFSIEMRGRSLKAAEAVLPIAGLEVSLHQGQPLLHHNGHKIELYPGDPRSVVNWLFGLPPIIPPLIRLDTYTPRIEIEGAVLQRATWSLPTTGWLPAPTGHGCQLMQHAAKLQACHHLPERGFVRLPYERKPFYLDFCSQHSLEFFFAMIRNSPTFTLTELLPTPANWWLKGPQGRRSCEWRLTMIKGERSFE